MAKDRIDSVLSDWLEEKPEFSREALGIVLRISTLAKILGEEVTHALNELELDWWEYDVLAALRRQGQPYRLTASDIAESAMISPGAVTNRIDGLLKRDFVTRSEDPEDRRRVLVELTPKGLKMINRASEARFSCAETAVSNLTKQECKTMNRLLSKLLHASDLREEEE